MQKYTKKDYLIVPFLLFLSFVPAIAGFVRLFHLTSIKFLTPENSRFFENPIPAVIHIVAVLIFSILGAFQFSPGIRRNHTKWHRGSGKLLVAMGLISAISGLWLTSTYPKVPTDGDWLYSIRMIVGMWMSICIILGYFFILSKRISSHSHWMIRGYAIGMGAGTQVFTHLPWFIFVGTEPSGVPRDLMMGAGWLINFLVAEYIVYRSKRAFDKEEHKGVLK